MVKSHERVHGSDEEVGSDSESVLFVYHVLVGDVLLNDIPRSPSFIPAHLSSFVERVKIVVFEVGQLGFFLVDDVFPDEED